MKLIIPVMFLSLLAAIPVLAASFEEEQIKPNSRLEIQLVASQKSKVAESNHLFAKDSPNIRLFAQLADEVKSDKAGHLVPSSRVIKVATSKNWPEFTITSFIILIRDNGTIAAFQEVPASESGDWFNTYTHYYDEDGNTVAFQRYSGFFNGCPGSSVKENSTYYFHDKKLIAKDYVLLGDHKKAIKPSECTFYYRQAYTIHKTWAETKAAAGIAQVHAQP